LKQNVELLEAVEHTHKNDSWAITSELRGTAEENGPAVTVLPATIRGDAIETFRHLHDFYLVDSTKLLPLAATDY